MTLPIAASEVTFASPAALMSRYAAARSRLYGIKHFAPSAPKSAVTKAFSVHLVSDHFRLAVDIPARSTAAAERDDLDKWMAGVTRLEKFVSALTIRETVAEHFGVSVRELISHIRTPKVTTPRQLAMALCRRLTSLSTPEIGMRFGGRDHTTVLHACTKYAGILASVGEWMSPTATVRDWVEACAAMLKSAPARLGAP